MLSPASSLSPNLKNASSCTGESNPGSLPATTPQPKPRARSTNPPPRASSSPTGGAVAARPHPPDASSSSSCTPTPSLILAPLTQAEHKVLAPNANKPCALIPNPLAPRRGPSANASDIAARVPGLAVTCTRRRGSVPGFPASSPERSGSPEKIPPLTPTSWSAKSYDAHIAVPRHSLSVGDPDAARVVRETPRPRAKGLRVAAASWPSPPAAATRSHPFGPSRRRYMSFSRCIEGNTGDGAKVDAVPATTRSVGDAYPGSPNPGSYREVSVPGGLAVEKRAVRESPPGNGASTVVTQSSAVSSTRSASWCPSPTHRPARVSTRILSLARNARSVARFRSTERTLSRMVVISPKASRVSRRSVSTSPCLAGASSSG